MKVRSTSALRRTLAALTLTAALGLTAACSGGQDDPSQASDGGGQAAASDSGGAAAGDQQMPEADVSDVPDVVAEVNGEEVTKDEFVQTYESQFQQLMMQQQSGAGMEVDQDELKSQVAEQLVNNELLRQGAADAGIEASDEDVDTTLDEIAQQSGLDSGDEVVSALEQQGIDEKQVREDAASQFAITSYIEKEADVSEPSEEELKEQYDAMVEQQSQAGGSSEEMPSFDEVKDQLAEQATTQQQNEAATELAGSLRESGDVTVNL